MINWNLWTTFIRINLQNLFSRLYEVPFIWFHRLTYKTGSNPKQIVVLGGSFSGWFVSHRLADMIPSGYTVTLIEKNIYHPNSFMLPRGSVGGKNLEDLFIPLNKAQLNVPKGSLKVIFGECTKISQDKIYLEDHTSIPYQYLIIATGRIPMKPARLDHPDKTNGVKELKQYQKTIEIANSVAIVGSGPLGVELACDIKSFYPDKPVDLYTSRATILPKFDSSVSAIAEPVVEKLGVNIIRNNRPDFKGEALSHYGLVINCTGITKSAIPESDFLKQYMDSNQILKVNPYLQVKDNIFAIGDACNAGVNMARSSYFQSKYLASNIVNMINGKKLKEYTQKPFESSLTMTLGTRCDLAYIPGCNPILFKHKEMKWREQEVEKIWTMFNVRKI